MQMQVRHAQKLRRAADSEEGPAGMKAAMLVAANIS